MSRYACNARIMSTKPIKSGTSARAVARTIRRTKADEGGSRVAETYVSTGRRGRDCSRNRFDVYPGLSLSLSPSRARSVIQKLKYRLINGSSFANFLKGMEYIVAPCVVSSASSRHHRFTGSRMSIARSFDFNEIDLRKHSTRVNMNIQFFHVSIID